MSALWSYSSDIKPIKLQDVCSKPVNNITVAQRYSLNIEKSKLYTCQAVAKVNICWLTNQYIVSAPCLLLRTDTAADKEA